MGYLFLFLALTFGIIKAYCGKRSSAAAECPYDAIVINTVRMVCCIFISTAVILISREPSALLGSPEMIMISVLSGIGTACFTVSWLLSVHTMAYMMVEVFVMGGTVIPLVLCSLLYKEKISAIQVVGIILLIVAVYCICTYKKKDKVKFTAKSFVLLLLCALSSGVSDFSQKLYVKRIENADASVFNLYTFVFAALVLLIASIAFRTNEKRKAEPKPLLATVFPIFHYVVIMAVCLFLNSYFKTNAAKYIDAVSLYPLNQGCAVVLSLGMSVFIFREKINLKGIIGVALSIVAMILINVFGNA